MIKEKIDQKVKLIEEELNLFIKEKKRIFLTSSFQTHSIPLLHIISTFKKDIDIYFIDTGFHFVETHVFKNKIAQLLDIDVKTTESPIQKNNQKNEEGFFYYTSNTNYCCHLNKVLPNQLLLLEHDIWISGVRRDQNAFRKTLKRIEKAPNDKLRYHPIIDWSSKMVHEYRKLYNLPVHPLEKKGFFSIGCQPCTTNIKDTYNNERAGRWEGQNKTECGLHTNLIVK